MLVRSTEIEGFKELLASFLLYSEKCIDPLDVLIKPLDLSLNSDFLPKVWNMETILVITVLIMQACNLAFFSKALLGKRSELKGKKTSDVEQYLINS